MYFVPQKKQPRKLIIWYFRNTEEEFMMDEVVVDE